MTECPDCGGDGRETCNNPDHGFITVAGGEIGRLGCPICGHDEFHKVPGGGACETCNGTGEIPDMAGVAAIGLTRPHVQNVLRALPADAADRKAAPITTGCIDYFPLALAEVARISKRGNDQHNPGQPLHWARGKSADHADCIGRHLIERGTIDSDGMRHTAKAAWRMLALLQEELELAAGWTPETNPA